ncbi:MAG: HAD family phosphatase [Eubacteriales bacterium]|nr:HAD family phosphatase [Eubacteriales bacterium]
MIKGAVFDADGTLLDSMGIWDTVGEDYLRILGYEPKENLNEIFSTFSLYQAACYYRSEYGVKLSVQDIMDDVNRMIETYYLEEVLLKPGAADFLCRMQKKNIKMCIATATDQYLIEAALKRCGIRDFFSEIFTCTAVGAGKDEPVIYREAQRYLGTKKTETIIFEDALHALKTAKEDGFLTAAVYDSHETGQMELKRIADIYLRNYSDIDTFWREIDENSTINSGQ